MNKWADLPQVVPDGDEPPATQWADPDQAVLDHMNEILGGTLFDGCGEPDCPSC